MVPDDSNPQSSFPFKLNIPVPRSLICHGMFGILCHEACEERLTRARKEEEEDEKEECCECTRKLLSWRS